MNNEKIPENNLTLQERQALVESNLNLVWHFVHKLCKYEELKDDAFQEGCVGLMRAARLYDESRDATFSAFAGFEIQCSIRDFLFFNREIKLPDAQRKGITAYYRKINTLQTQEIEVTPDILMETAKEFGLTAEVTERLVSPTVHLQSPIKAGDNTEESLSLEDTIAASNNIEECLQNIELQELITFIMDSYNDFGDNDPVFNNMLKENLVNLIKKGIGNEEEAMSMLDIVREHYPEYVDDPADNKETKAAKRRALDNIYCRLSARWVKQKKELHSLVKSYLALSM